jgi:hypothetical protein
VHERDAREVRLAVDENRAGAAVPLGARDLRARQSEVVAECLCERAADGGLHVVELTVNS